ncbi:hypothetical protein BP6252_13340 [Coleophoma cylindrospora]|uniref:Integrase catalytic domain-containing protein n=1 Tax=Coleophoma cylindrospora TaxID=1849047 RepID=A0A3D8QBM6_9HELO|nr:hypothetical protein BP6252_13340 [Coleophoma cylindrospora]
MPDTGAAGISTAGEPQLRALQKIQKVHLDRTTHGDHKIKFGKGSAVSKGTVTVDTPLGKIQFQVVPDNTPFLFCIQDMDRMGVKLDNLQNVLIQGKKTIPIVQKWGHPWMMLKPTEEEIPECYLTDTELRQLHRRFGHPSVRRLTSLLERAGYDKVDLASIKQLTKFCAQCQLHSKAPGRFKFTLKDEVEFNYAVFVDILYLEGKPVLHVVDEATAFATARFLKDQTTRTLWDTLRSCWIDTYLGPPDFFVHDAGKNFSAIEFQREARTMAVEVKEVPTEAHNSVGKVERYHAPLRRSYEILREELKDENISRESILQMAVKAINDTAGPNGLVPTLLVFGAYPRMTPASSPSPSMVKRATAVQKAMDELRRTNAKRQVSDALAMRNGLDTSQTLNLPLQSDVRVWREKEGWTGPYKLLHIDGETCTVQLRNSISKFRTTVVRPFYTEDLDSVQPAQPRTEENLKNSEEEEGETTLKESAQGLTPKEAVTTRPRVVIPFRSERVLKSQVTTVIDEDPDELALPTPEKDWGPNDSPVREVFVTKKEQDDLQLAIQLREKGVITTPGKPFEESQRIEIDGLIAKGVFEFAYYDPVIHTGRVFGSRLVNEVKGKNTAAPYEKSRMVIQAYNDKGKEVILTQSPTIQRASQRLILALAPMLLMMGYFLFGRDITQAYTQAMTSLNRLILASLPKEIRDQFPSGIIIIVRKPLYGIPEARTHWWATYHKHHIENLKMMTSSYDPCLLITQTKEAFGVVGMQTDDTLILGNQAFVEREDKALKEAKLSAKKAEVLTEKSPLTFNGGVLHLEGQNIRLVQKGQGNKIDLVTMDPEVRTAQYREQRARGAYLATICQPEASLDLSMAAQHQEPTDEEIKTLNKRLKWQMENMDRGITYVPVDLSSAKLFVFVDGSFANNKDLSSQIGYVIILANESYGDESFEIKGNLIHWSSTKSKRVTRSVLASEIYGMVSGVDMAVVMSSTIRMITEQLKLPTVPIIVCTDSYSLYECLVKLGTTKEKRLMIDIMALRQSYERRELTEVRWINGQDNPADAMTKANPNKTLERLLDTNVTTVRIEGWVKREEK